MANRHRGEVSLQVGSETYVLRLSVNEMCNIEQAFGGKPINEIMEELEEPSKTKLTTLRTIIHAALKGNHKEITEEEAGEIMSEFGTVNVIQKLIEAMTAGMPEVKITEKNPK